jgi:hypothetical protein
MTCIQRDILLQKLGTASLHTHLSAMVAGWPGLGYTGCQYRLSFGLYLLLI